MAQRGFDFETHFLRLSPFSYFFSEGERKFIRNARASFSPASFFLSSLGNEQIKAAKNFCPKAFAFASGSMQCVCAF